MYETAEEFFKSLGFGPLLDNFYSESMLEKPSDGRSVECHGRAWDFFTGKDFRFVHITH